MVSTTELQEALLWLIARQEPGTDLQVARGMLDSLTVCA
jgi:hypothetical protein